MLWWSLTPKGDLLFWFGFTLKQTRGKHLGKLNIFVRWSQELQVKERKSEIEKRDKYPCQKCVTTVVNYASLETLCGLGNLMFHPHLVRVVPGNIKSPALWGCPEQVPRMMEKGLDTGIYGALGVGSCQMLENYSLLLCFNLKMSWGNTVNRLSLAVSFIPHRSMKSQERFWVSCLSYVSTCESITVARALSTCLGSCVPLKSCRLKKIPQNPWTAFSTKRRSIIDAQASLVDFKRPQEFK